MEPQRPSVQRESGRHWKPRGRGWSPRAGERRRRAGSAVRSGWPTGGVRAGRPCRGCSGCPGRARTRGLPRWGGGSWFRTRRVRPRAAQARLSRDRTLPASGSRRDERRQAKPGLPEPNPWRARPHAARRGSRRAGHSAGPGWASGRSRPRHARGQRAAGPPGRRPYGRCRCRSSAERRARRRVRAMGACRWRSGYPRQAQLLAEQARLRPRARAPPSERCCAAPEARPRWTGGGRPAARRSGGRAAG